MTPDTSLTLKSAHTPAGTDPWLADDKAMEKRGLLGAIAMAAVQDLCHPEPRDASASASSAEPTSRIASVSGPLQGSSMRPQRRRSGRRPPTPERRRGSGRGASSKPSSSSGASEAGKSAGPAPAAAAVAEMLSRASECSDIDEIFKSLADVLAEAQEESQQVGGRGVAPAGRLAGAGTVFGCGVSRPRRQAQALSTS